MTYEQLENNYKTKKEKLDAMLELKTKEEILALYEDESFCEPGQGKTDRFFEAFMEAFGTDNNLDENNSPEGQQPRNNAKDSPAEKEQETDSPATAGPSPHKETPEEDKVRAYTAAWTIRCGEKVWTAGQKVAAEEFGADFKRLLEIGALVQK